MRTVNVNLQKVDAEGNEYGDVATPEVVANGWMINKPIRLRLPDGSTVISNEVLITPKGLEHLRREMPIDLRGSFGGIQ